MTAQKKELAHVLDLIEKHQRTVSECHDYYQKLEKELESKKAHLANPEDLSDLVRDIAVLNREYGEKSDLLYEELNQTLIKGHDLAKKIGNEVAHDFKALWDYMTDSVHTEVKLPHVIRDLEKIRKTLE